MNPEALAHFAVTFPTYRALRTTLLAATAIAGMVGRSAQAQQVVVSGVPIGASATAAAIAKSFPTNVTVPAGGDVVGAVNYVTSLGGGTVTLQAGIYNISQSILPGSNVAIIGQGPASTVIYAPETPNGVAMIAVPNGYISNLVIQNLTLDGNIPRGAFSAGGSPYANSGLYIYGNNNPVNNVSLQNVEIRNTGIGILATVTNSITFNNVYVHDNNPGNFAHNAYLVGCDFVYILHSRFMAAHTGDGLHYDFSSSYYLISKSEFSNNNGEGILDQGSTSNTIQDSIINNNSNDGINYGTNNGLITRDNASYNAGYGYNVPGATLSDDVYGVGDGQGIGNFVDYIFTNLLLQANPSPNQYPAILATGVTGATDTADWITSLSTPSGYYTTSITGYSTIGAVDFNTNHMTTGKLVFPSIGSSTTGATALALRYANGTTNPVSLNLSVNGGPATTVAFPPTGGWSTWNIVNLSANLSAGNNVVTLATLPTATANPLIDYLQVAQATPAAPAAPTGVKLVANSPYQTTLTWNAVPGAQNYVVSRIGGAGFSPVAANVTGTTYTDNYLLLGNNTVTYVVYAVNQGGTSPASAAVSLTTPTDAPAGFQLSQTSTGNVLTWMSANGAKSYNVNRSVASGGPYTRIANVTTTSYTDTTAQANVAYYYTIQTIGATVSANSYELNVGLPGSLTGGGPAPLAQDIGATGGADLTEYAPNATNPTASVYGLAGSGAGLWSNADAFRYVSMPVVGDVTMTARLYYLQAGASAEQAGIDIRETLAPNATNAFVGISGGLGAESLIRSSTGATTSVAALTGAGIKAPYWVRMTRAGNVFTSSISPDGKTWTVLSAANLSMASQAYIGLGESSTTGAQPTIALFDNVSVTGGYGF